MNSELSLRLIYLAIVCGISVLFARAFANRFTRWPAILCALVASCLSSFGSCRIDPIYTFSTILIAINQVFLCFKSCPRPGSHSVSSLLAITALLAMLILEIRLMAKIPYLNEMAFAKFFIPGLAGMLMGSCVADRESRKLDFCLLISLITGLTFFVIALPQSSIDRDMFYFQSHIAPLITKVAVAYFSSFFVSLMIKQRDKPSQKFAHTTEDGEQSGEPEPPITRVLKS